MIASLKVVNIDVLQNYERSTMQKKILSALMLVFVATGCASANKVPQNAAVTMNKITGLKMPESVVQGKDGRIFVSEINGFGQDGDGQITVIDTSGKASVFVSGLDDPKGLAIIANHLYVADKNKVLKISPDGKKGVFASAEAFSGALHGSPYFLNDLEADPQGNLYVSDSGDVFGTGLGGAIFKINPQGQISLIKSAVQEPRVKAPNGLLADDLGNTLIVVDLSTGVLYSIEQSSGKWTELAEGFGGGDGLTHHSNGTMYISDWKNGKVFSVNTKGDVALVKGGYQSAADIALTKDERYIMVPDMKAGELDFIPVK
jgi:sugar lactone lactonase YvrE